MVEADRPVFIIGGSRTGSEMLKTMLSSGSTADFVDELFLHCPRWLHRDLDRNLRERIGPPPWDADLDRLVDLFYSKVPYGWVWENLDTQIERDRLHSHLQREEHLDMRGILRAVMCAHAEQRHKTRPGAKFPMHYSYTDKLLAWFPDCLLIHTTRDPRAVYASQANKYLTDDMSTLSRAFCRLQHFAHINIQIAWTAQLHKRYEGNPNYRLVQYENVIVDPKGELRRICDFIEIEFSESMLSPEQYGSSFRTSAGKKGVRTDSIARWQSNLPPLTKMTISAVQRQNMAVLGYE